MSTNNAFQSLPFLKGRRPLVLLCFMLCCCAGCSIKATIKPVANKSTTTPNTMPVAPETAYFKVLGKASLSNGKRHAQISLRWQQRGEQYVINLYGPLGSGAVRLSNTAADNNNTHAQPSRYSKPHKPAIHYQDMRGAIYSYGSAEKLLENECGWRLPIAGLEWWLRGLPRPKETAIIVRDKTGLITQIEQDGWRIEYQSYQSIKGKTYPHKVRLKRDNFLLKFVLRDWHIDTKTLA